VNLIKIQVDSIIQIK